MKRSWVRGKGVEKGPEKRKNGERIRKNVEICDIFAILEFSDRLRKIFEGGMEEERDYERF